MTTTPAEVEETKCCYSSSNTKQRSAFAWAMSSELLLPIAEPRKASDGSRINTWRTWKRRLGDASHRTEPWECVSIFSLLFDIGVPIYDGTPEISWFPHVSCSIFGIGVTHWWTILTNYVLWGVPITALPDFQVSQLKWSFWGVWNLQASYLGHQCTKHNFGGVLVKDGSPKILRAITI